MHFDMGQCCNTADTIGQTSFDDAVPTHFYENIWKPNYLEGQRCRQMELWFSTVAILSEIYLQSSL